MRPPSVFFSTTTISFTLPWSTVWTLRPGSRRDFQLLPRKPGSIGFSGFTGFLRVALAQICATMLMTLCSLGKHWKGKPHTIPVAEIREIWEAASAKGR